MKRKTISNYSGITICDSITMSVKKRRPNIRRLEAVLIALIGFVSVITSFLNMFNFNYNKSTVFIAAIVIAVVHISISLSGKHAFKLAGISLIFFLGSVYYFLESIISGYKYVYNIIYSNSKHTLVLFYKNMRPENESQAVTIFFIFCIWLIAMGIFIFTIRRPNPIAVIILTFPIIEIGLYNGIKIPIICGMLTVAYWLAVMAMHNIDTGEYFGGSGGFVRKGNVFFPKRQMRLKVTEKCAFSIILSIGFITAITLSVMKITNYERSENLKQKRIAIKEAANSLTMDDMASGISAITEAFGFNFSYETHKLGNLSHITYKNVVDLTATFDKNCEGAVYLKGYAGSIYEDNEWTDLKSSAYNIPLFTEFMSDGIYPQDFPHYFADSMLSEESDITVWLNAERKKNKSYAPYGTNNFGDMKYNHDLTVSSKKNGKDEYSYKFIGIDSDIMAAFSDLEALNHPLEKEYREFVYNNYLDVPDNNNMNEVREAYSDIINTNTENMLPAEKLELLENIRNRISSETAYTLSPGETPSNRDFVNYFLLENHKGYCTHYATSGVLLSRMAGIPARYATGYVIVADDFNENSMNPDGSYTIKIMDSRSHAWAEIYIDGFGWIPFEFTKGYSASSISEEETTTQPTEEVTESTPSHETAVSANSSTTKKSSASDKKTSNNGNLTSTLTTTSLTEEHKESFEMPESAKNLIKLLSVIVIISAIIYARRIIILKLRKKHFIVGKYSDRTAYMYNYAKKLLEHLHIKENEMQYIQFSEFVDNKLAPEYFDHGEFIKFVNIVLEGNFGDNTITEEKITKVMEFTDRFSQTVYRKSGVIGKIKIKLLTILR